MNFRSFVRHAPWLLTAVIWLSAGMVYMHALLVMNWIGYWPKTWNPAPSETPFPVFDIAATLVFMAALATPLSLFGWGVLNAFVKGGAWLRPGIAACILSYAAWWFWAFHWDPGALVGWFLD